MPKIVYAPILEQAGFLKRKAADVVEQWVAQLDGAMQSWQLTESINLIAGDKVRFKYKSSTTASSSIKAFYSRDTNYFPLVSLRSDGAYTVNAGAIKIDGVDYQEGEQAPIDGEYHEIEHTLTTNASISLLGAGWISFSEKTTLWHLDSALLNFEVERASEIIHQIPLTNKSQGATQLATVGDINAFMPNYTDAVWRKP